jgi:hypothetical protein
MPTARLSFLVVAVVAILALPSTAAAQRAGVPDTTPPGPVVAITPLQVTTTANSVRIRWSPPAGESHRVGYRLTLCDSAGCRALPSHLTLIPVALGVSTLQVLAVDRAGNSDPAQVRTWTITRNPAAPMLRFLAIAEAKAETDGRTLTVSGTMRRFTEGQSVRVTARARVGRRMRSVSGQATVRSGAWSTQVKLPSAAWRVATVTASTPRSSWYEPAKSVRRVRKG